MGGVGGQRLMKTDGNICRQDLTIWENTIFQGLVMGSITVAPNVILNEGSKLELYGQF